MSTASERILAELKTVEPSPNGKHPPITSVASVALVAKQQPWPQLAPAALYGPLGDFVRAASPYTEADPIGVYMSALAGLGAIIGPRPHALAGNERHPAQVWPVLVGETAKAGKGTAWAAARTLLAEVNPRFIGDDAESRLFGGFASGEALIDAVKDSADIADKRMLVVEPEFARVLKLAGRDGSILSQVIRAAWDGRRLETRARSSTTVATGHHIALLGHVTAEELRRRLDDTETYGGFSNRFLWVCVRRSKRLPEGGNVPQHLAVSHAQGLSDAIETMTGERFKRTTAAEERWAELYDEMGDDDPGGILGATIARAEPYTLRLSLLLALLDGESYIDVRHIDAGYALWRYCRDSAAWIWGDSLGDPEADKLLAAIRHAGPTGMDGTAQRDALGRHGNAAAVRRRLEDKGLVVTRRVDTGGRPADVTVAIEHVLSCDQSDGSDGSLRVTTQRLATEATEATKDTPL